MREAEALSVGVGGHAVGNLLLAALIELEQGDFEQGVREMNRVLAVRGRVVPATAQAVTLHADLGDGTEVEGQSRIARSDAVDRVWIEPADVRPTEDAMAAIGDAEVVVIGPGSLYTSILPALLVPGIAEAIAASGALVVFACNVATQPGETRGFDLADHVDALARHGLGQLPDVVIANNRFDAAAPQRLAGRARAAPLAAGLAPRGRPQARARRRRRPGERPPPRPAAARGGHRRGVGARGRAAPPSRRGARQGVLTQRMAGADRDLVAALRAELAAVDPSRACDRHAEIAGLGARDPRPRAGGRAARRPPRRQRGARRSVAPAVPAGAGVAGLGDGARALPLGLDARPVPRPRLAEPRRRPRPSRVRRPGRRGPGARRPARRAWA